jgi:hypothetical protein
VALLSALDYRASVSNGIPRAVFDRIDNLVYLRQSDDQFTVHPGSMLAADDDVSTPLQVSYGVRRHLDIAIDHLHTVRMLAVDADSIPTYGVFTLLRAAVENLGSAMWLLRGADRVERVRRELCFQLASHKASASANELAAFAAQQAGQMIAADEGRLQVIERVAARNGLTIKEVKVWAGWGSVVRALGLDDATSDTAEYLWKSCSAFAHGDPWPSMAFLEQEELPASNEDIVHLRLTVSFANLTPMLQLAVRMADLVLLSFDHARADVQRRRRV